MTRRLVLMLLAATALAVPSEAASLFSTGSSWRWRPGTNEASTPVTAWRQSNFNDLQFTTAPAPFWYGDPLPGGTEITGMQNVYLCLFLRKTFVVSNVAEIAGLRLGAIVDDGFVAWINGTEIKRVSMPEPAGSPVAITNLADNAVEPVSFMTYSDLPPPSSYLVSGTNVLAVQVFQSSLASSDIGFDCSLESILTETNPPSITTVTPAPGTVSELTQVTVKFSEPVQGVNASDLLVNGVGTAVVLPLDGSTYTFTFPQPAYGTVALTWAVGHGIVDEAIPANGFNATGPGATWQYNLVDTTAPVVAGLTPPAGATIRALTAITVVFSEGVQGVGAADLLINDNAASSVTPLNASQYVFSFPEPPTGTVRVAWATGHGIRDLASAPNAFAGGSWSYRLDPSAEQLPPYISEFMASNTRSLMDDFGEFSDWIELYNPGALSVNLEGWYLTDTTNNYTRWRFPATNLAGGAFLVVFATERDRQVPGARLHTNFRLSAGGEYLGLIKPDGATIASEFRPAFPSQVPDVSFGVAQLGEPPFFTAGTNGVYFTRPTPGLPNIGGTNAPGPAILEVRHTPNLPLDLQDLLITARVLPSFFPVAGVSLRYRVMFSNEVTLLMFDDGAHGDGLANDGLFAAVIPASASSEGQMIRYYITATDVNGRASRWPLFTDRATTAEYLGTVVNPNYVTSVLPVIHLFAPPTTLQPGPPTSQIGADSQQGTNGVSVFYDGEFYDNVYVALRGNTTAGYSKKSHRFEFNREHPFRHPGVGYGWPEGDGPRIRRTSFVADYPDPTYMRQGMSFWLCEQLGSPGSFYYPVRLQLNGQFYQLANHNDVHSEELLERIGYDPNGALYNAAGTVQPSQFSTGGFEKKTREWEGNADYLQLANAISESLPLATRRTNAFEMLDLPNVINYLVAARFVQENDDVWANMSLYHDNDGDNLWRIVGFDMNLSWGAFYYDNPANDTGIQATNDIHKSFPLYGSSAALSLTSGNYNRIYDIIFQVPETRQMFLRRMRTMLDALALPPGSPLNASPIEQKVLAWRDLITTEGNLDRAKWQWPAVGGQNNLPPGTNVFFGVQDLLGKFFYLRRQHFYGKHSVANTALAIGIGKSSNAGIPLAQPANAFVSVVGLEANPVSGNQDQEYIRLTNPAPFAVELSGWKLEGAVDFTFAPGTVIPANSVFYVSPNIAAFRSRTAAPRGGQGLFVLGPYRGQLSARGETVEVRNGIGNIVHRFSYAGAPTLAQQFLRVTELMYHPAPLAGNPALPDEFEYIELRNISTTTTLNLAGVRFTNGVQFSFTGSGVTTLAPGARVLVVRNLAAFTARYGTGLPVAGQFIGSLDNDGERIRLIDGSGEEILDFAYDDDWYPVTDGLGFSLVTVNENAEPDAWSSPLNWRVSSQLHGSPGSVEGAPPVIVSVLVNEVLSRSDVPPPTDSVELFNPSAQPANIGGWWLTDDFNTPQKYRFTNGTTIPPGGYLVLDESQFNAGPNAFGLSSDGDEIWLFSADAAGNLTGYVHGHDFGAADDGVTFGRYVTSDGDEHFVAQAVRTLNATNAGPRVGPVVINEIMYHPPESNGTNDNSQDEFVELLNMNDSAVPLFDSALPANSWKITGGIDFVFPTNTTLQAGEFVLLVNFAPGNATTANAFRLKYGVAPSIRLFGPYAGKLDNSSDDVEVKKPTALVGGNIPYVLVDKVRYRDSVPWPVAADGYGLSLQRRLATRYGNEPSNWSAAPATSGRATVISGTPPVIGTQPESQTAVAGTAVTLAVGASGTLPFRYQWRFRGLNIPNGTNSLLSLLNVQPEQAGEYQVAVFNAAGSSVSSNAFLAVVSPAAILQNPSGVVTNPGAPVSFSVIAYSASTLRYQWQKDGVALLNATNATLNIASVQPIDSGSYTVVVRDDIGSATSSAALLSVLVAPLFVEHPLSQTVVPGANVTLSWAVTEGATLPMGYRIRRNGVFVTGDYVPITSRVGFITITNAQPQFTNYQVAVSNAVPPPRLSNPAILSFVSDFDNDGLPDAWEVSYGLATNVANGGLDADNDSMSNWEEYIAGTDPRDPSSYLKVNGARRGLSDTTVEFIAVALRTYTVEYSDALGTGTWHRLADVVARATNRIEFVRDPISTSQRYYRLVTPRAP